MSTSKTFLVTGSINLDVLQWFARSSLKTIQSMSHTSYNGANNETYQAFNALNYLGEATLERGASIGPEGAGVLVRDVGVAHVLGAVIGVAAAAVPVALDRLGLKRHVEAMVLSNTNQ